MTIEEALKILQKTYEQRQALIVVIDHISFRIKRELQDIIDDD